MIKYPFSRQMPKGRRTCCADQKDIEGALCRMMPREGIATMLLIETMLSMAKFDLFVYIY